MAEEKTEVAKVMVTQTFIVFCAMCLRESNTKLSPGKYCTIVYFAKAVTNTTT